MVPIFIIISANKLFTKNLVVET